MGGTRRRPDRTPGAGRLTVVVDTTGAFGSFSARQASRAMLVASVAAGNDLAVRHPPGSGVARESVEPVLRQLEPGRP